MLEVLELTKTFGGLAAVSNLSLEVEEGEIRGIIGPNGAGKTTLFNLVSGVFRPSSGEIRFHGKAITGLKPSTVARMGLVRTFQRNAMFPNFTVLDNVMLSRHLHVREGVFGAVFATARGREAENRDRAIEIIEFLDLGDHVDDLAGSLAHGHQRTLGIANALAVEPKLLMLDEPVAGMNPTESAIMMDHIRNLRDRWNITVLLVEHDMRTVMGLCEKITVLNFGEKLAEGTPDEIRGNEDVITAYLGSEEAVA
jgi:branched-chain amino acid transport system ATP-binding protein